MGVGLFILSSITGLKVEEVFKGCLPFLAPLYDKVRFLSYPLMRLTL